MLDYKIVGRSLKSFQPVYEAGIIEELIGEEKHYGRVSYSVVISGQVFSTNHKNYYDQCVVGDKGYVAMVGDNYYLHHQFDTRFKIISE